MSLFCHLTLRSKKPKDSKYPAELRTLGDHLKSRRLDLGLLQREVAERLRVAVENVRNWEWNRTKPAVRFLPGIYEFLGYEPEGSFDSFPQALRASRRAVGLSQRSLSKGAGLDQSTIAKWERGDSRPFGPAAGRLFRFFERIGRPLPDFGPDALYNSARRAESARKGHGPDMNQADVGRTKRKLSALNPDDRRRPSSV